MKLGLLAYGLAWSLTAWLLTGCSFSVDVGYHGRTGIDNRTQTTLAPVVARSEEGNERKMTTLKGY